MARTGIFLDSLGKREVTRAARRLEGFDTDERIDQATMTYIIAESCIGVLDRGCVDVCPVDCIYEGADQLYIHPDECIDCGACEPECPVTAIFPEEDVPEEWASYTRKNYAYFEGDVQREVAPGRGA